MTLVRSTVTRIWFSGCALVELGRSEEAIAAFEQLLTCEPLPTSAQSPPRTHAGAANTRPPRGYLGRVAERDPDNRELWIERCRRYIERGEFGGAAESARRVETLPGASLLGRLLAAQAIAARNPLGVALETVGVVDAEQFKGDEYRHQETIVAGLATSVRNFGPRYLPDGLLKLRSQLPRLLDEGVLGGILTDLLTENTGRFAGSLDEWETVLRRLASSLADVADCQIPLEMLHAAVTYTKTGDEKKLLSLPLEQRQLLQDVLPPPGFSDRMSS